MRDNHEHRPNQEQAPLPQILPAELPEYMPPFPYQMYPPYWGYPYYSVPHYPPSKYGYAKCKNCRRMVSYNSVMTQTSEKPEQDEQLMESVVEENVNLTFHQQNIPQKGNVKLEEKEQDPIDIRETSKAGTSSQRNEEPELIEKEIDKQKDKKVEMKDDIFQKMLAFYLVLPIQYDSLVSNHLKNNSLLSQLIKYFHQKVCSFKKSKQEMIKLIIRKTQRHYKMENNCRKDDRFKKFGGFKSMNSVYLQKLFSDPYFARCYLEVIRDFIQQFQADSTEKLNTFMQKVYEAESYAQFKQAMRILEQKNKMPWPAFWIQKLRKVVNQLKMTYINEANMEAIAGLKKKPQK